MIRAKRHFMLPATRRTGKTSAPIALRDLLNRGKAGHFRCVNVEVGQVARDDTARYAHHHGQLGRHPCCRADDHPAGIWPDALADTGPESALDVWRVMSFTAGGRTSGLHGWILNLLPPPPPPPPPPASGSARPLPDAPLRKTAAGGSARPFASTRAATGAEPSGPVAAASSRPRPRASFPGSRVPAAPRRPLGSTSLPMPRRGALRSAPLVWNKTVPRPSKGLAGGRPRQRSPLDARPRSAPVTSRPALHAKPLLDADSPEVPSGRGRSDPNPRNVRFAGPAPARRALPSC